jgi:AAA+ superfamily predicted ATPase
MEGSFRHLLLELSCVDTLIRRKVRLWQLAGQDPEDAFRGLVVSDKEALNLTELPLANGWGDTVSLSQREELSFTQSQQEFRSLSKHLQLEADQKGRELRLPYLTSSFGLDKFEVDTLLICLAPALDLRYERLYGYLQDDVTRKRPTINLVLSLLCEPGLERLSFLHYFHADSPLFLYHLLTQDSDSHFPSILSRSLSIDPTVLAWLLGKYQPGDLLSGNVQLLTPAENHEDTLLAAAHVDWISNLQPENLVENFPALMFHGPDQAGQDAAARLTAARLEMPLLQVNLASIISTGTTPLTALRLALRDARLVGAIPYLIGWDACLAAVNQQQKDQANREADTAAVGQASSTAPYAALLSELFGYPGPIIVSAKDFWQPSGVERNTPLHWFNFQTPPYHHRLALWDHYLTTTENNGKDLRETLTSVAGQFTLTGGQIRDAVASAMDMASQGRRRLIQEDLFASARIHSNPHLGALTRKIDPRYTWEDIILPQEQTVMLREITATVRERPLVLDEWGLGKKLVSSTGIPILFSGPPGTGKTMAAEVLARELGLDLYKIDLSGVVSKYIGETEKNLERIFNEAENSNAILFFDEADAIFGKRSEVKDAHDRYANIEISYLLQRMEVYSGITILATNLRANLDEAFTRRLQFVVDFPFPEEEYRLRIWKTLFPPGAPREENLDFGMLANRFKLAGGNIRNIIVNAAYLAAADEKHISMDHLLHAVRREFQKMGRLVPERDLTVGGKNGH